MEKSMSDIRPVDNGSEETEPTTIHGTLNEWPLQANCKGHARFFFPKRAERPEARVRREGKAHVLCEVCAVQKDCRTFARNNHEYGYWGDENEESRHAAGYTLSSPIGVHIKPLNLVIEI